MRATLTAVVTSLLLAAPAAAADLTQLRALLQLTDPCLASVIDFEQGGPNWSVTATNPRSGAYGLPQALPGHKMRSAGTDWRTNPITQIRWARGYVAKYGGSCGALTFQRSHGWY